MSPTESTAQDSVTVVGTGRAAAAPDTVVLDLQLEGHGATVSEALAQLSEASHTCVEAAGQLRVSTQGLGVHPRHDHQGRQVGHTAYQQVRVTSPEPGEVGGLVQRLSDAVGNGFGLNGLRPEVADTSELLATARERAFGDAHARAEQYAALTGRSLGRALSVREDVGGPTPFHGAADSRMAMAAGPVVEAADHEVVQRVRVKWELTG